MTRLFIIEDHATIIVSGFKRLFYSSRDGIEVTGFATTVDEAIESCRSDSFDVFILDLWLENRLPVENVRKLAATFPSKPVIIYTSEGSFAWRKQMYDEGVRAYLTKNASRPEIKTAIEKVMKGERVFPVSFDQVTGRKSATKEVTESTFTPVQKEILAMLARGLTHKEIANSLLISASNVEKTLKALRLRYKAKNNIELLSWLEQNNRIK